jgi:hypothetical protein
MIFLDLPGDGSYFMNQRVIKDKMHRDDGAAHWGSA